MVTLRELPDAQVEAKRNEHSIVHIVKGTTRLRFSAIATLSLLYPEKKLLPEDHSNRLCPL